MGRRFVVEVAGIWILIFIQKHLSRHSLRSIRAKMNGSLIWTGILWGWLLVKDKINWTSRGTMVGSPNKQIYHYKCGHVTLIRVVKCEQIIV
ncbi:unnamed protein product [Victoria cruziana]